MVFFSFRTLKKNFLSVKSFSCATIVLFRSVEFRVGLPLAFEIACGVSLSWSTCVKENIFYLEEKISHYFHLIKCISLYPLLHATISNFLWSGSSWRWTCCTVIPEKSLLKVSGGAISPWYKQSMHLLNDLSAATPMQWINSF